MKKILSRIMLLVAAVGLVSCELDNYSGPDVFLKGKVVYQGQQLYLRNGEANFRLYEEGWELSDNTYLTVPFAQDGTFSANIFKGKNYRIERQANIGPWLNPTNADIIRLDNYDGKEVTIEVTPYYMLENVNVSCSGKVVTGTATVKKIAGDLPVEKVGLYVSRNYICDANYSAVGRVEGKAAAGETFSYTVDLNSKQVNSIAGSLPKTGYIYARVGLKVQGITAMIYSEPFKLNY